MAMRTCAKCRAAENPIGRLRFKKYLDGKVYCENCLPASVEVLDPTPPATVSSPLPGTSAGSFVVIPCPDCRGVTPNCEGCAGYGSVRIPQNFLRIYVPKKNEPETLTEG
jgi:hypothetical protein